MLKWFEKSAPIRLKFRVLLVVHALLATIGVATTWLAIVNPSLLGSTGLMIAAVGALVATIVTVLTSGHAICTPYVNTVVRMENLAAGDLTSPIEYTTNTDCVGRMTKAMAVFQSNAKAIEVASESQRIVVESLGTGLGKLANNDLTHRITTAFSADYEVVRDNYNRAMDAMSSAMSAVTEATSGINNGAGDIRQASDDLSHRTEQQAASLEETAAAMHEITTTVRQTAEGASRANTVVGAARVEAEKSGEIVSRAVEAMGGIERASAEISDIISVIDGIAFQTNLLALNAGVEAARAGDAGRGFAVVASEVRALAQRSADAAKDVKTKITASSEQVDIGVGLVSETGKALTRIIERIAEISTLVSAIAISAEQQATGLQQVNTAVGEMDSVTQQNAAMVEEATAAARSLAVEADSLAREVARFKLDTTSSARQPVPVVHQLQDRVANASRSMARPARRKSSGTAVAAAVSNDDWSNF